MWIVRCTLFRLFRQCQVYQVDGMRLQQVQHLLPHFAIPLEVPFTSHGLLQLVTLPKIGSDYTELSMSMTGMSLKSLVEDTGCPSAPQNTTTEEVQQSSRSN